MPTPVLPVSYLCSLPSRPTPYPALGPGMLTWMDTLTGVHPTGGADQRSEDGVEQGEGTDSPGSPFQLHRDPESHNCRASLGPQ